MAVNTSQIFDLAIGETLNGGDIIKNNNDVGLVFQNENQIYLALMGGNADGTDWWANQILFANNKEFQFVSNTERALNTNPLTSSGRIAIETAVNKDLEFLSPYATVEVTVSIIAVNAVKITVNTLWNDGKKQLTIFQFAANTTTPDGDYSLEDYSNDYY